ncbi:MFS transporter [Albimonas pacifica]|uniref:MFS transporter, PPP family, 3-phenylpropionic acid transporter n=1 Tax=Albimonas pacifica TaxID=1114924 RepID=A0A1I3F2E8_9RHOB|nr:MFS transporter [Albimonas pacifica]SFI05333.1 MFS transporter, PPP family, 3-phenylpropionic acid transporter [Albimonas pacifica]
MSPPLLSGVFLRTSGYYVAFFGAMGVYLPFWPLWLKDWGLSEAEIGVYTSAGIVMRLLAGLALPVMADRMEARRLMLAVVGITGAALFLLHLAAGAPWALLALTMLTAGVFSAMMPIGDALGAAAARSFGFEYAHARAVGSASFLVMNVVMGGALALLGADAALWAIVAFLAAAAWLGGTHPGGGRVKGATPPSLREMRRLVSSKLFVIFALASGFAQASHGVQYVYASVHWRALGVAEETIGLLWAFGVLVEVGLMIFFGPALVRRLGAPGAIALAGGVGALRWAAMTLDPTGPLLWVLQGTHALSFAAAHLGSIAFIQAAAPERLSGAAQAVMQVLGSGVLMAGASAAAAVVYPQFGGGAWWIAAAMSTAALLLSLELRRRWDGTMQKPA